MKLVHIGEEKYVNADMIISVVQSEDGKAIIYLNGYQHESVRAAISFKELLERLKDC